MMIVQQGCWKDANNKLFIHSIHSIKTKLKDQDVKLGTEIDAEISFLEKVEKANYVIAGSQFKMIK